MNLGVFFAMFWAVGTFLGSLFFFINVCGAWVNCYKAWVCKECMDCGLVVIKLLERWLDRESCRKIAGEVP